MVIEVALCVAVNPVAADSGPEIRAPRLVEGTTHTETHAFCRGGQCWDKLNWVMVHVFTDFDMKILASEQCLVI